VRRGGEWHRAKSAQRDAVRHPPRRTGSRSAGFQFFEVREQFLLVGPTLQVQADHLIGPQGRFAARPQRQQQAGDDRQVGLDFNPGARRAE